MNPYRLYHFSNNSGETEFVVISDMPKADVIADYVGDYTDGKGVELVEVLDIDGDCTSMPCDRRLTRE